MKKMVSVDKTFGLLDPSLWHEHPLFKAVVEVHQIDHKTDFDPAEMLADLVFELETFQVNAPGFGATNVWQIISQARIPHEQKIFLVAEMAGVLRDHQLHARVGTGPCTPFNWRFKHPRAEIDQNNPWVGNWVHTVEEVLNLFVFSNFLNEYNGVDLNDEIGKIAIASLITDSRKRPTLLSVFVHHIDGANWFKDRLAGLAPFDDAGKGEIYVGVLSHQFSPAFIMASIGEMLLKGKGPDEVVASLRNKLFSVLAQPTETASLAPFGTLASTIVLSDDEMALLRQLHPEFLGWFVPSSTLGTRVVQVDSLQYMGLGLPKCLLSRVPGMPLAKATLEEAVQTVNGGENGDSGPPSSIEASRHAFTTDREIEFFDAYRQAGDEVHRETMLKLRHALASNPDFIRLNEQLPANQKVQVNQTGMIVNVPYLDVPFPGTQKGIVYVYEDPKGANKAFFEMAVWIHTEYIRLFRAVYDESLKSGQYYRYLQPPTVRSQSLDDSIFPPISETPRIPRQYSAPAVTAAGSAQHPSVAWLSSDEFRATMRRLSEV